MPTKNTAEIPYWITPLYHIGMVFLRSTGLFLVENYGCVVKVGGKLRFVRKDNLPIEEEEEETPDPIEAEEPPRAVCPVCENANDEDNMTIVRGVYVCDDCTDYFHRMLKREEEAYAAGVREERERCSKILSESFHELDGSLPSDYPAIFRKANDKIFDKDTTKEATT